VARLVTMGVLPEMPERVRKALLLAGVTIGMGALMAWSLRVFGARSAKFAFLVVWLPLAWFACLGA
jgi:hypothetical protein